MKGDPPKGSKKGKRCETKWCRGLKAVKANGYLLSVCWKCRSRWLKLKHPFTYTLNVLRRSAKKRNLPFDLTKDDLIEFDRRTNYMKSKGRNAFSMTIDRINPLEGYTLSNIRILSKIENGQRQDDEEPF